MDTPAKVRQTGCVVVGGGPGGMMLAFLLARRGIDVTLLEAHRDFDREFRGDTVHPSTLDLLDQLGLGDRFLQIPHGEMRVFRIQAGSEMYTMADLSRLRVRHPFVAMVPQDQFLDFLAAEARKVPAFHLELGANVQRLVEEDGVVKGVQYRAADGWHEVRAPLTVGADGRFSKVRSLADIVPVKSAPPMDVLWFRLPRDPADPVGVGGLMVGTGAILVAINREHDWQFGYVFPKGGYAKLKEAGLETFRRAVTGLAPWLGNRVDQLRDWHQCAVLSVESSICKRWYKPGLLLIGDAAHVMSPVGGVGINYAIQDAVETTNLLAGPLAKGRVKVADLAAVQRARQWPVQVIQFVQGIIQKRLIRQALGSRQRFRMPLALRVLLSVPGLRNLPGWMIAYGPKRVRLQE